MARILAGLLVAVVVVPLAGAVRPPAPKVRPAVPADDSSKPGATEWWQVLAFDPATRTFVRAVLLAEPYANFRITVLKGTQAATVLAADGMAILPQSSPGVTMVGTSPPPGVEPPRISLRYAGGS